MLFVFVLAKEISFSLSDGKIIDYTESIEEFADGSYKRAKILDFSDNNLDYYCEGYEKFADGSEKIVKEYELTKEGWQAVIE